MNYSPQTLILVAVGVATAGLAIADPILGDLYFTAGLLLFAFGVLAAIYSDGQRRAFWVGFVILFGIYCNQTTWAFNQFGGPRNTLAGLLTSRLLAFAYEGLHPTFAISSGQFVGPMTMQSGNLIGGYVAFLAMGHTLIATGLGLIAGRVAQRLASHSAPMTKRSLEKIMQDMDIQ